MGDSWRSGQWVGAMVVAAVCLAGCLYPAPTPEATSLPDTPMSSPTLEVLAGTPTPSSIPPTRTPRPTPVPTMTADEEYGFFLEMLQNNGGCQLPCWWGFTPGATSWQATRDFFTSLGKETRGGGDIQNYTVVFDMPGHYQSYQSYIGDEDGILKMIEISAAPAVGEDWSFTYDHPQFAEDWKAYMLPHMLEVYGPPSQVLLGMGSGAPWSPFDLLLFYPEKGFLMQYSGEAEEREGETWLVCPHLVELTLYLWSPERIMSLEDIPGFTVWGPHSLEEATGMSIEQFYETFVQPDTETCLETPADLW
ncbi:MAG: hypothetical protein JW918_01455 [Anaerolineae bacterium]|nr:hypothetical protein [Anaerolineae bacterium]